MNTGLRDEYDQRGLYRPAEAVRALGIDYELFRAHANGGHFPTESFEWKGSMKYGYPKSEIDALAERMRAF